MSDDGGSSARGIGALVLFLAFAGAVGGWFYLRMSSHPSERGAAACQAVESYIAAISHHHGETAWRATTPAFQAATPLAAHQTHWHDVLHQHGRITSVAVVERSASYDYGRLTVRATLGMADQHYAPVIDYEVTLGRDGKMRIESGCEVTESRCAPGAW